MSENFLLAIIGSVGVPAAILFFILLCLNKHVPVVLKEACLFRLELKRLSDSIEKALLFIEGEK